MATRPRHASDAADQSQECLRAIARAQAGDSEALGYVYSCYSGSVLKYVRTIVGDDHEAQDVTQHVFAKLITAIGAYERQAVPFSAWILRVARNAAIDHLRARRTIPQADVCGDEVPVDEVGDDRRRALMEALKDLPADQREVLVLRHLLGLSPGEIAKRLGRTEVAVHSLHYRGRRILCRELAAAGSAPSRAPASEKRPGRLVHPPMREARRPRPAQPISLRPTVAVVAGERDLGREMIEALAADGLNVLHTPRDIGGLLGEAFEAGASDIIVLGCELTAGVSAVSGPIGAIRSAFPHARIVLVAPDPVSTGVLRGVLRAGVDAVVFTDHVKTALAPTIRAVYAEQVVFPRGVRREVEVPVLSHREREVLRLVVGGCTNDEIADTLYLATSTVKCHLTSAFAKLGVRSRNEAVSLLLDPEHPAGHAVLADAEEWARPARAGGSA